MRLLNGQIWRAPNMLHAITQWLTGDQWILLGTPEKSASGGTASVAMTDESGKMFYTERELAQRLETNGWTLTALTLQQ